MTRLLAGTLLLLAFLGASFARADVPVPPLQTRVTDLTGTLSEQQRQALEQELAAFEQKKGSQIAVLIVPTTDPETIEQYALRVAEQWKLGRKGVDDGALLLVAKNDRKLRIEVGYGLEGVLPDAGAKRIVSDIIVPYFKQGDYYGGIKAGVDKMIRVVEGEPLPPPKPRGASGEHEGFDLGTVVMFVIFGLVATTFLSAMFGRFLGGTLGAGGTGIMSFLASSSLLIAVLAAVAVLIFGTMMSVGSGMRSTRGGRGGGWGEGFPSGGGGWGGRGGGGLGGGGWSGGGGGGFGGGGASGNW